MTVTLGPVTFDGESLEIAFSENPYRPSPYAASGATRMEIPVYDYIDDH